MNRRLFLQVNAAALAAAGLDACMRATTLASRGELAPTDPANFAHARRFASTSFGEIAYVSYGSGPAALFLHGYPLNGYQWRGVIDRLRGIRRCVAPDLMGLGYSNVPASQAITPEAQADMLVALLDHLDIEACDVVANDTGGLIAQLLVMRSPQRVRSLLLTNCDTQDDCPARSFKPFITLASAGGLADRIIAPALVDKAAARGPRGLGGLGYSNPLDPTDDAIEMYFSPIVSSPERKTQFDSLTVGLGRNALAGSGDELRKFRRPVRIVWGADDTVFAKTSPQWLDRTFPASRGVRLVEHAKLFFPEEQPDVVATEARLLWTA